MGLFDVFKDKDDEDDKGGTEEINFESFQNQDNSSGTGEEPEPKQETTPYSPPAEETPTNSSSQTASQIGIEALMDKRAKLEEAIDYVGLMIKNLKDKRTKLVKNIEDESVDIRNLKEKLTKINQFIQEENDGLQDLTSKRSQVEKDADDVGNIVYGLRDKISEIDKIVADEAGKIKSFKDSRSGSS